MGNRERKVVRAENNDPINFTCGKCKQVVPFLKIKNEAGLWDHLCAHCDSLRIRDGAG